MARIEAIEHRQVAILEDINKVKTELQANTEVTNQVRELLLAPATFWAWCSKWGKRISIFAKFATPVVGFLVLLDQLSHIDVGAALKRLLFMK